MVVTIQNMFKENPRIKQRDISLKLNFTPKIKWNKIIKTFNFRISLSMTI